MTDADQRPRPAAVPDKPVIDGLEAVWSVRWEADQVYAFDRTRPRAEVFSIDTPPPTVSGSLHVGHAFSYTHTDIVARYRRMTGLSVFYPIGWDDNGLPTERRVQNVYGVRGDASLPYDPSFVPPEKPGKAEVPVSRRNFIELCERLTAVDERAFEEMWRRIGLSVDWSLLYTTISDSAPAGFAAGVPAQPSARGGVPGRGADAVGRHLPDRGRAGRARGPRGRRCVPPDLLPRRRRVAGVDRDDAARAAARLRGAGGAPGRRPVPVSVRVFGADAGVRGVRCRCSRTRWPSRTRGRGSRWCAPSAT